MNTLCKPSLGGPGHVTKILQAQNWQKVDGFEPIYLEITDIDKKRFVVFERTINHLSFGYVHLPQLENYFSCFTSFFFLFFFFFFLFFFCHSYF